MVQLDALRAFAVLAVIVQHTVPLPPAVKLGRTGVRLFYVLSGFLITGILLRARRGCPGGREGRGALRSFYARRFLRIFPLYYLVLGLAVLLALPAVGEHLASCATYTSNIQSAVEGSFFPPPLGHFWSLAVEEQFYLFWPLLILFLPTRRLLPAILLTIVIGPVSRLLLLRYAGRPVAWEVATTSCLDTLGVGALLALFASSGRLSPAARARIGRWSLGAGLALLGLVVVARVTGRLYTPSIILEDTAYVFLFGWLVSRAARGFGGWGKRILELRPLVYLGTISYGVYVYHNVVPVVARVAEERLGVPTGLPAKEGPAFCLYVAAVTVALAACSWHLFEAPLNRLKKHFPYLKPKTTPSTSEGAVSPAGGIPVPAVAS
jgi:peptidoglycan/LPS O-acetylase OafA/YrhL